MKNIERSNMKNFLWFSVSVLILGICVFVGSFLIKQKNRKEQLDKFYYDRLIQIYFIKNGPIEFENREIQSLAAIKELERNMFKDGYNIAEVFSLKDRAEKSMQELIDEAKYDKQKETKCME